MSSVKSHRPPPAWVEPLLAELRAGAPISEAAQRAGTSTGSIVQLARRRPDFAAALEAARPTPARARRQKPLELVRFDEHPAGPLRYPLDGAEGEGLVSVAAAVVRQAQRDAARGCPRAATWLDQVRADVLGDAPTCLVRRVGGAD